jgi:hypothetical protein
MGVELCFQIARRVNGLFVVRQSRENGSGLA